MMGRVLEELMSAMKATTNGALTVSADQKNRLLLLYNCIQFKTGNRLQSTQVLVQRKRCDPNRVFER